MRRKKRSTGFILTTLCTFALLMAASGLSAFSFAPSPGASHSYARHGARLAADTPEAAATDVPGVAAPDTPNLAPTDTAGAAPNVTPGVSPTGTTGAATNARTYMGQIPNAQNAAAPTWLALDSNGSEMVAFTTDASKDHPATFARWYKGTVQDKKVSARSTQANAGTLDATLTQDTATGTITMQDGKKLPFTASLLDPSSSPTGAGLYKGEKKVNGDDYVAGWILMPKSMLNPSATATPSATQTATSTPASTATPTMTASPTATSGISGITQSGSLYDKKNNKVQSLPELSLQDVQAKKVTLPKLGEFTLAPCQQNLC